MDRLDRMITASSAVIGLRAKACAAKQLSRLDGFSEPLSDEQRVVLLLLLASATALIRPLSFRQTHATVILAAFCVLKTFTNNLALKCAVFLVIADDLAGESYDPPTRAFPFWRDERRVERAALAESKRAALFVDYTGRDGVAAATIRGFAVCIGSPKGDLRSGFL
jgi:hypothetical protein